MKKAKMLRSIVAKHKRDRFAQTIAKRREEHREIWEKAKTLVPDLAELEQYVVLLESYEISGEILVKPLRLVIPGFSPIRVSIHRYGSNDTVVFTPYMCAKRRSGIVCELEGVSTESLMDALEKARDYWCDCCPLKCKIQEMFNV